MSIDYYQPFVLLPTRVWRAYKGGRILDRIEGKANPVDSNFPEDWVGSATRAVNAGREDIEEGICTARAADGNKIRMDDLFSGNPDLALGKEHVTAFGTDPRLLVKLLDSSVRLHMQAHPSVAWSQANLNDDRGKTEVWWVLASRTPDPYVYFGFQHPPTSDAWGRMMKEQDTAAMQACFAKIPVSVGDVLLIEGGVPHAIGEGLFVVEVQEPTDYVVKSEFEVAGIRLTESAATMGRGVDGILDLFDYSEYPADSIRGRFGSRDRVAVSTSAGTETVLLEAPQTDRVEVRRLDVSGTFVPETDGRYSILIVLEGEGSVAVRDVRVDVQQWSKLFVPACTDTFEVSGSMQVARCLPPGAEREKRT